MKQTTILIPLYSRLTSLGATLTSLCFQADQDFDIVISDQNDGHDAVDDPSVQTVIWLLDVHGRPASILKHLPRRTSSCFPHHWNVDVILAAESLLATSPYRVEKQVRY